MKAELITLHAVRNYGSVLQAYATQELFEKYGVDITVINFIREDILPNNILKSNGANIFIKKTILYPSIKKQGKIFSSFCNNYLHLSSKQYTYEKDFENYKSNADFFITGSDQVWNSTWNKGIIKPLYLSFIKNKPKIAYAASFGKERIDVEEINDTKELIEDYLKISVCEKSAVELLDKQYNYKNAIQILDPTLALDKEKWISFAKKGKKYDNYVLIYQLNRSSEFDKYAKKVAKKMNCKLIRICRGYHQLFLPGKGIIVPSVETFVSLFANAKMVITDSFHALSFCTNLNVPFACFYPNNFNTRLKSHLELFNLLNRKIDDINDFSIINKKIDWNSVNDILREERKKNFNFIEDCINEIKK